MKKNIYRKSEEQKKKNTWELQNMVMVKMKGSPLISICEKLLSLGPIGGFGGALYKIGENRFTYNGAPSVIITFDIQEGGEKP